MAPNGAGNIDYYEYPFSGNPRRSQRIASSAQTPLRNQIDFPRSPSPNKTIRANKQIASKPQIVFFKNNSQAEHSEQTPVVHAQKTNKSGYISEEEDNVFQTQSNHHEYRRAQKKHEPTAQELLMMDTPLKATSIFERFSPRSIANRTFASQVTPSSPLLSIPTVKMNRTKKVGFEDEQSENISSIVAVVFGFPFKFFWNNIQTILKILYFVIVIPIKLVYTVLRFLNVGKTSDQDI